MSKVEARFICDDKRVLDQTSVQVRMTASIRGRDNTEWAPYTPSGQILMVVNGSAGAEFVKDARYRVIIERTGDVPEET